MPWLEVGDCVSYEVKGALHLTDYLIRFQLVSPRNISEYAEFVLRGASDLDALLPDAPNRDAVLYNVNAVKKTLDNIFFRIKKGWFARTYKIASPLDFLQFSVDHTSNPTYVFTNGQSFVSLVVRDQERFETVGHSARMSEPDQEIHELIEPDAASCFASYNAAETAIRERLGELHFSTILVGDGTRQDTLLLQAAGGVWKGGHFIQTYIAWVHGEGRNLQTNRETDPYTLVNAFRPHGLRIESCGTCAHFKFSGASRDMSGGSTGHCMKRVIPGGKLDFETKRDEPLPGTIVSVWNRCPDYSFIEHQARHNADSSITTE